MMQAVTLGYLKRVPAGESDPHIAIANTIKAHAGLPDSHTLHVPQEIADLLWQPENQSLITVLH